MCLRAFDLSQESDVLECGRELVEPRERPEPSVDRLGTHIDSLVESTKCQSLILVDTGPEFFHHSTAVFDWRGLIEKLFRRAAKLHFVIDFEPNGIASQLRDKNIVKIHDVNDEEDFAFIVSDFIDGTSLNRWRKQRAFVRHWSEDNGECGMGTDQLKELKRLQKENDRLRRAVSDLTLDKLILSEAARGNY